ncbi:MULTISPECIES: OmpH family outer membrane protein [Sphingobacterium]|jgi:outer membrane protein|uniref:OmpH family outer membrane protein n=1 Tax=Sphingobacterium TaxID=28453 RepID=UPI000C0C081F|nr:MULTISPECIES: OmpH family outer membrane protein [Sphingobacterium]MCT1532088.1 OmpH family outer membrane protein [Sphingobacterium daejeonense]
MKRIAIIIVMLTMMGSVSFAQKLAYVDSEYVMKHIPEYNSAIKQMDDQSKQWQAEVDRQYDEIERMYQAYQKDQANLNADMRRRREDEIVNKEKAVKEFQRTKFGMDGDLFKQRENLMKPIQAKVSKAIQDVATAGQFDFIMDKRSENSFLYANPSLDKSNDVITKLGLRPNPSLAN